MRRSQWTRAMAIVTVGAVVIRLAAVARFGGHPMPGGDQAIHLHDGRIIADGHLLVLPNAPFGIQAQTALAVALGRMLDAPAWAVAGVVNALLGGATVALIGIAVRRVASPAASLAAAAATAASPELVIATVPMMSEPAFTALVSLVVVISLLVVERPSTTGAFALGLAIGLASAFRPVAFPLIALGALAGSGWRSRTAHVVVVLAGAATILVPLSARASLAADSFVASDLRSGTNWCIGRLVDADGGPRPGDDCDVGVRAGPVAYDHARAAEGWRLLRAAPEREPGLAYGRIKAVLDPTKTGLLAEIDGDGSLTADERRQMVTVLRWASGISLASALIGSVWAVTRRHPAIHLVVCAALLLVAPAATVGDPRYRLPLLPLMLSVGAVALVTELERGRSRDPLGRGQEGGG